MSTNYCDTCQKSDCACIYSICLNHQPLDQMPVKKTRKTNRKKINWVCCNSCKPWAHPKCTGLTNKEFKKINNTELKKNNSSLFLKCLKCSIKAVTSAKLNLPAPKDTATSTREISTQTISLESTISTSINSLNQITSNLTPSKKSISPVTSISASITQSLSSTEKNNISQSSDTSNKVIRIIDNIPKDLQTNNSNLIKETTTDEIPIDFTYTLPKGGIAIHLPCEEDTKKLENNLDQIYLGSYSQQPQSHSGYNKVIVKNLDPSLPTQEIKENIEEAYQTTIQIKRYHPSLTKRPLPIICITYKGDTYPNFLSGDIRIFNKRYKCQPYNKPAICCLAILLGIAEIVNTAKTAEKLILKTLTVQKTQCVLTVI